MSPADAESKRERIDSRQKVESRRDGGRLWVGPATVAVLLGITGWNLGVIVDRYGDPERREIASVEAALPPPPDVMASPDAEPLLPTPEPEAEPVAVEPAAPPVPEDETASHRVYATRIRRNQTVGDALTRLGLAGEQVHEIVASLRGVFDFRRSRPGDAFRVKLDPEGQVVFFDYERTPIETYCAERQGAQLVGYQREITVSTEVAVVLGTLRSSLYESMGDIGERPELALLLAEVLAWDIDFYRDPHPGDTFRIVVEKRLHKGRLLDYGELLAAEYKGAPGTYRVFRYETPDGRIAYYDAEGKSAQKALLKSPMKFAHVTSTYGMRRHPILGYSRMHQGVDYGAPSGTPVWSVGDGTVVWAGYKGASGNLVGIRHTNGYSSWYAHLSKIHVRSGQRVSQKQVIGRVGTTGRSTGPHLHYSVKRDGTHLNPLAIKLPPRQPLPKSALPAYREHIAELDAALTDPSGERLAALSSKE